MIKLGLAAGIVAAAFVPGLAEARCSHSGYQITPSRNSSATVDMRASSGRDCVIRLSASRRFTVTGRRIVEHPGKGKVTIEGETAFYRSFAGFVGEDRFVAEVSAKGSDGEGTSTILVVVTVE
ncbi:hypothetical protein [uncultured Alsobacter sp.]|uniref:hypothetical protein n=1 Tax=uncultured Alsobacter sp. TaxID=1748258 RepID=UPI0025FEC980|nr:hypothetical protein [uncultured Alsobacter sp.]